MRCIKDRTIQKYIDTETSPKEVLRIEKHIATCKKCAQKVNYQKKLAVSIKSTIDLLSEDVPEIRKITIPTQTTRKKLYTRKRYIYSIASVAAACILLIMLFTYRFKKPKYPVEEPLVNNLDREVDANRTISQQQFNIYVIDPDGNITEYPID